jgi:hypothetical protein
MSKPVKLNKRNLDVIALQNQKAENVQQPKFQEAPHPL